MAPPKQQNANAQSGQTAQLSAQVTYDRAAACAYAVHFAPDGKLCHDDALAGKVTGRTVFSFVEAPRAVGENDCTHFVSCCIGDHGGHFTRNGTSHPVKAADALPGGNVHLVGEFSLQVYGYVSAPGFVSHLLSSHKAEHVDRLMIEYKDLTDPLNTDPLDNARATLTTWEKDQKIMKGDVLVYSNTANINDAGHLALYMGDQLICCHSDNRLNKPFSDVAHQFVGFLHIVKCK